MCFKIDYVLVLPMALGNKNMSGFKWYLLSPWSPRISDSKWYLTCQMEHLHPFRVHVTHWMCYLPLWSTLLASSVFNGRSFDPFSCKLQKYKISNLVLLYFNSYFPLFFFLPLELVLSTVKQASTRCRLEFALPENHEPNRT